MKRQTVERKKTQAELIDLFKQETARIFAMGRSHDDYTEFVNSKNKPTLQAMVKRGILDFADKYTDQSFILSAKSVALYGAEIRAMAYTMLQAEIDQELRWHRESTQAAHHELYVKYCATNVKREYWTNTPEFTFIDWCFHDDLGSYHRVNFSDHLNSMRNAEERIQESERCQSHVENASLLMIEVCAIR